jgi:hypothetical protein
MNRKLRFLLPAACCLIIHSSSLLAQEVDHVYLKSGSVIRGNIIEIEPVDHVKIQDLCGNIWYYSISQVEKITCEPYQLPGTKRTTVGFGSGFVNLTSIGFLAGSPSNMQAAPFTILMINGWRNSFGLFTGAGAGIEFLTTSYLPLFLDVRYDLSRGDVVPYIVAKGGYSLPLARDHSEYDYDYAYFGGPLAGAGIGLKLRTRSHCAWDSELMYRYQKTAYSERYEWNGQEYRYTDIYNRLEVRLGFYID